MLSAQPCTLQLISARGKKAFPGCAVLSARCRALVQSSRGHRALQLGLGAAAACSFSCASGKRDGGSGRKGAGLAASPQGFYSRGSPCLSLSLKGKQNGFQDNLGFQAGADCYRHPAPGLSPGRGNVTAESNEAPGPALNPFLQSLLQPVRLGFGGPQRAVHQRRLGYTSSLLTRLGDEALLFYFILFWY